MNLVIIPRKDDGTFDLYEKSSNGKLEFLSNHDTVKEAEQEKKNYHRPMSQEEIMNAVSDMKKSLEL